VSDYPEPLLDLPGPSGRVPAVPTPPRKKPAPRLRRLRGRASFTEHATRMGRELTRVGASFRFAGIIIMIGALLLAAQNALILGVSLQEAIASGVPLDAGVGQNNSSANATFTELVGAGRFYSRVSLATQFDLVGFSLLGVGLLLFGRGSRNIELRVVPRHTPEEGGVIEFSVTDMGPGIKDEVISRLYEAFFSTKAEGLGIGLSLCRSIIESHRGRIRAQNLYNGASVVGCSFTFTLPVETTRTDPLSTSNTAVTS